MKTIKKLIAGAAVMVLGWSAQSQGNFQIKFNNYQTFIGGGDATSFYLELDNGQGNILGIYGVDAQSFTVADYFGNSYNVTGNEYTFDLPVQFSMVTIAYHAPDAEAQGQLMDGQNQVLNNYSLAMEQLIGNNSVVLTPQGVPEPGTNAVFLLGVLTLVTIQKKSGLVLTPRSNVLVHGLSRPWRFWQLLAGLSRR